MKKEIIPIILAIVNPCVPLTKSRKLGCNSAMAGIQAIGLAPFDSSQRLIKTPTGVLEIASIYGANSIARFEVKNTTVKAIENGTSGGDNRSKNVKSTLPLVLNVTPGEDVDLTTTVEKFLNGCQVVFIERKKGDIFAFGSQCGADSSTIVSDTGGQGGDFDGFTVTFTTDEPDFSRGYKLVGEAITQYAAALMPLT